MRAWAKVAVIKRAKASQGGLVVQGAPGLPFLLRESMEVAFVPPVLDVPRRAHIEQIALMADGRAAEVQFSGITTRELAEQLVSCFILVRRSDLPDDFESTKISPWLGFSVVDRQAGAIGQVVEVIENPGQSLLRVESEAGDVLVPFVDALIVRIDEDERIMHAELPQGLLDLSGEDAPEALADVGGAGDES